MIHASLTSDPMELQRLTPDGYAKAFEASAPHVYNTVAFAEHNAALASEVGYFALRDANKLRLGLIAGRRDGRWLSPFSAPFGGMTANGYQSVDYYREFAGLLRDFVGSRGEDLVVTLPPEFYAPGHVAKQTAAFAEIGSLLCTDLNFHRTVRPGEEPRNEFFRKTVYDLRNTDRHDISVVSFGAESSAEVERAYDIIARNHAALGYPLKMSLGQVISTAPITGSRFTVLSIDGCDAAAAMVNRSARNVAQVIYWGDLLEMRGLHPMVKMAETLMAECAAEGIAVLDIGPSSSQGVPSPGLCRFKESVGCVASVKSSFVLR